ncbi:aspartyl/asparaginyl beta-hydroxylase domain-containing protein [Pseudotenacibaculum sp. MALMAid0570]|uniref:aspartyl/asparaginyl beta-hydroxylase domain-containing protein n=1 Tax=Pseudotenacibaculum sp. MALMAid0570 TaxID=3143938 RepID=UPI0032DEB535
MMNVNAIKLPFRFDGKRMKQELQSISDSFQLIKNAYTGNSLVGMHLILPAKDGAVNEKGESFYMTDELKKCSYLQEVLNTFQCDKFTFRVQNLLSEGKIGKHNDGDKGLGSKIVRLNIPVSTNDSVYTFYNGERILMENGECWLPNVTKIHEMINKSDETRWMLMIDCDLNDWWKEILADFGVDFSRNSQFQYYELDDLKTMKENFLRMGANVDVKILEEIDNEIAAKLTM